MARRTRGPRNTGATPRQPFVPKEDRPEVKISLDTPVKDLRVRELSAILGYFAEKDPNFEVGKTPIKDFFDKDFPEVIKDWVKDTKGEKLEKPEKLEKNEKLEKVEKYEKSEFKEIKNEKLEREPVFDPGRIPGPDPRMEQVIVAVAGLTKQVSHLANQVEELRKKIKG